MSCFGRLGDRRVWYWGLDIPYMLLDTLHLHHCCRTAENKYQVKVVSARDTSGLPCKFDTADAICYHILRFQNIGKATHEGIGIEWHIPILIFFK